MICPACEYEFDPAGDLACPRCGEALSCSGVSCAECDACSGLFDRLRTTVVDQFGRADSPSSDGGETVDRDEDVE